MSEGCTSELMMEHEGRITAAEASTASAHHRIDELKGFRDEFHLMNTNVAVLVESVKSIAETLVRHEEDIAGIKETMETKDSVARLHERYDDMSERLDTVEKKDGVEAEKQLKQLKWLIVSTIVGAIILYLLNTTIFDKEETPDEETSNQYQYSQMV